MHILLNDAPRELPPAASLLALFDTLSLAATSGVAAAVNDTIIARQNWHQTTLNEGDRVLIIRAAQGG